MGAVLKPRHVLGFCASGPHYSVKTAVFNSKNGGLFDCDMAVNQLIALN